jgi:cyclopentanol dehydrogenase
MTKRLENKVSIVTGGASGIGEATVKTFLEEGSKVCVIDNNKEKLETFASYSKDVITCLSDVTHENSWKENITRVLSKWSKIDVLVNNAGVSLRSSFEEMNREEWDNVFAVNSTAVMLGTQSVIEIMKKNKSGSIINISSIFGLVGSHRSSTAYHASKGATRIFSKTIAAQYGKYNIRSNSIHPGFTDTPMTKDLHSIEDRYNERLSMTPMGRLGTPEDIAYGALYLASEESSWVTGSELVIDGGETCW